MSGSFNLEKEGPLDSHREFETRKSGNGSPEFLYWRFRDALGLFTRKQLQGRMLAMLLQVCIHVYEGMPMEGEHAGLLC